MTQGPFDKQLIRRRAARLALTGPGAMPEALHAHVAEEMLARLAACDDDFDEALVIATAPADFAPRLRATGRVKRVRHAAAYAIPVGGGHDLALDPEAPALERESLDLVLSLFDLALVNDLPGAL
ncbi:MAG TPA: SAM-dependent methyltransferase, partial [Thermopetrobacter sp.]|nr:SAM-dependent methyltransferase [Thermopetrobacter sp.]